MVDHNNTHFRKQHPSVERKFDQPRPKLVGSGVMTTSYKCNTCKIKFFTLNGLLCHAKRTGHTEATVKQK